MRVSLVALSALFTSVANAIQGTRLYQFPHSSQWIENLAVRPNGDLVLTTFENANIYGFHPAVGSIPSLLTKLQDANVVTGIAQIAPDIYAFSGGTINRTAFTFEHGKIGIIDLSNYSASAPVPVRVAAQLPDSKLLNGMAALPLYPRIILSADSLAGVIWRVDTTSGKVDVVLKHDLLLPLQGTPFLPVGVNGIRVRDGYLYFSNTARQLWARVKVTSTGDTVGDVQVLTHATGNDTLDDFDFTRDGTTYIATPAHSVGKITTQNVFSAVYHNETFLDTITSVRFSNDQNTLYTTTAGSDTDGGKGGQIIALSL